MRVSSTPVCSELRRRCSALSSHRHDQCIDAAAVARRSGAHLCLIVESCAQSGAKSVGGSLGGKGLTFVAGSVAEPDFCHPTMRRQRQECANSGHSPTGGERSMSRRLMMPGMTTRSCSASVGEVAEAQTLKSLQKLSARHAYNRSRDDQRRSADQRPEKSRHRGFRFDAERCEHLSIHPRARRAWREGITKK